MSDRFLIQIREKAELICGQSKGLQLSVREMAERIQSTYPEETAAASARLVLMSLEKLVHDAQKKRSYTQFMSENQLSLPSVPLPKRIMIPSSNSRAKISKDIEDASVSEIIGYANQKMQPRSISVKEKKKWADFLAHIEKAPNREMSFREYIKWLDQQI